MCPISIKRGRALGSYPKGQFYKNTVYLERGMPYFALVDTNAVLVKKNRWTSVDKKGSLREGAPDGVG